MINVKAILIELERDYAKLGEAIIALRALAPPVKREAKLERAAQHVKRIIKMRKRRVGKEAVWQRAHAYLLANGPQRTAALAAALKVEKQAVWSGLSSHKKSFYRLDNGEYRAR